MFGLVDLSNFYASCEQTFRPSLRGKPVVVLGSNDGCVIARSQEAKALGVPMGAPWFKVSHLAQSAGLVALSANFPLIGDMSARFMSLAAGFGHQLEAYSVDEAFADLSGIPGDLTLRGFKIRARIRQWLGLECGVGLGGTKTLAKLANLVSKDAERKPGRYPAHLAGVCNFGDLSQAQLEAVMRATAVGDVWGVGRRYGAQLLELGVVSAWDLAQLPPSLVRKRWGLVLERTVLELQGVSCIDLEAVPGPKKQVGVSRSFGKGLEGLDGLLEAVGEFAARAAVKLRKQGSVAGQVFVFAQTSPFRPPPHFSRGLCVPLASASADTRVLVAAAHAGVRAIFQSGVEFNKAGVFLLDLCPANRRQEAFDFGEMGSEIDEQLMATVDHLNQRFGRGTVLVGGAGNTRRKTDWSPKQSRLTPQYTTRLSDIPVAKA